MADPIEQFFDQLAEHGQEPLLEKVSGTCRFDIQTGKATDHFLVSIDRGVIRVSRGNGDAECVVKADRALFEGITQGEINPMAAMLRGALVAEGRLEMLMLLQRIVPGKQPVPDRIGGRHA